MRCATPLWLAALTICLAPAHAAELRPSRLPRHHTQQLRHLKPPAEPRDALVVSLELRGGAASLGETFDALYVPLAFAGWFLMNIKYSMLNKQVLMVWKFPYTFAALQLLVGALWICLLWLPWPTGRDTSVSLRTPPEVDMSGLSQLLPVGVCLALGHALSTVAPAYGTVAFTNVVKTLEPLFTCALSALFLRQIFSLPVYLSLVPVIVGVILASTNEVSFSMVSLLSGLLSNLFFALRAISAKRVMDRPLGKSLSPTNMYGVLTLQALVVLLPLALLLEGPQLAAGTAATIAELGGTWPFVRMLLMTGVSHYVYNECAFIALSAVHPITHAVANTVKRVAVIVITVLYFRNPLTPLGTAGTTMAIAGVLLYSLAKARDTRLYG